MCAQNILESMQKTLTKRYLSGILPKYFTVIVNTVSDIIIFSENK